MAKTPEGKVKTEVKKLLANTERWGNIWTWWPVPSGYGRSSLDCLGCYRGLFFAIETKAPGEEPTPRQEIEATDMRQAGGPVFVIDGLLGLSVLEAWLERNRQNHPGPEGAPGAFEPNPPQDHT